VDESQVSGGPAKIMPEQSAQAKFAKNIFGLVGNLRLWRLQVLGATGPWTRSIRPGRIVSSSLTS
jgi:hypothetical protein